VRKYDAEGTELWTRTHEGESWDAAGHGVATDAEDNVLVVGHTSTVVGDGEPMEQYDTWVAKYDAEGTELWTRTHSFGTFDWGYGVAVDGADDIAITGIADNIEAWLRKYDASGTELWTRTFQAEGEDHYCHGAATDSTDSIVVVGTRWRSDTRDDVWVHKSDASGTDLWTRTFDGGSDEEGDFGRGIATDSADNVLVVGRTHNGTDDDIWIRKYTP
jgi:hypothetical protein